MLEIIKIIEIVIAVLLAVIILIQPKKSSLNLTTFWNDASGKFERRWAEKTIHKITIALAITFVSLAVVYFFLS